MAALQSVCASIYQPIDHLGCMLGRTMISANKLLNFCMEIHEDCGSTASPSSPSPPRSQILASSSMALGKLVNITPRSPLEAQRAVPNNELREYLAMRAFNTAADALCVLIKIDSDASPATAANGGRRILNALLEIARATLKLSDLIVDVKWGPGGQVSSDDLTAWAQILGTLSKTLADIFFFTRSDLMLRAKTYFAQLFFTLFSRVERDHAPDIPIQLLSHTDAPSVLYFLENICDEIISMGQSMKNSPARVLRRKCSLAFEGLTFFLKISLSIDLSPHHVSREPYISMMSPISL